MIRNTPASATETELTVKGAPEVVLSACGDVGKVEALDGTVAEMAAGGLRVIAVAKRKLTAKQAQAIKENPDDIAEYWVRHYFECPFPFPCPCPFGPLEFDPLARTHAPSVSP